MDKNTDTAARMPAPPPSILPPFDRPPWFTPSTVIAAIALIVSCTTAYLQFRDFEEVTLGVLRFDASSNGTQVVLATSMSFANTGTRPAIINQVRLVVPKSADFRALNSFAWRRNETTIEPPLFLSSKSLEVRSTFFRFPLIDAYMDADGRIPLRWCAEVVGGDGRTIERVFGEFAVLLSGSMVIGMDGLGYKRFGLLPKPTVRRASDLPTDCVGPFMTFPAP